MLLLAPYQLSPHHQPQTSQNGTLNEVRSCWMLSPRSCYQQDPLRGCQGQLCVSCAPEACVSALLVLLCLSVCVPSGDGGVSCAWRVCVVGLLCCVYQRLLFLYVIGAKLPVGSEGWVGAGAIQTQRASLPPRWVVRVSGWPSPIARRLAMGEAPGTTRHKQPNRLTQSSWLTTSVA